jgi:predicted helicase
MEEKNIEIEFKKIEIEADIKDISLYNDIEFKKIEIEADISLYHDKINNIITDKIINSNINYKQLLMKIINKFNLDEKYMNKLKGNCYEYYILNYMHKLNINENYKIWLWKNVPLIELYKAKIISFDQLEKFANKKYKNKNPISDFGIDILLKKNNEYIFIQCKNHIGSINYHHLSGFFMMMTVHSNVKGIVYYTSTLNKTLNKYANISDRCQYIKLLMI